MPHTQHRRRPLRLGHPATPQRLAGLLLLTACLTLLWACLSQPLNLGSPAPDQGAEGGSSSLEGGVPLLLGQMTIAGCQTLTFPGGEALCVGVAPLKVRLVLIDAGVTTHRWQLTSLTQPVDGGAGDGGPGTGNLLDDVQSRVREPEVLLQQPGTYDVALGVLGPGGTASASGQIVVQPVELGGRCARDGHCAQGLKCLCGADQPLVDGTCPGGLAAGMCTRSCDGLSCPAGSLCMDLSRTTQGDKDTWRRPICVPSCGGEVDCRSELTCRDLPALPPSGKAGDPYTWARGCFLSIPGGIGDSCITPGGLSDPPACITGLCEPLGLRNLCSAGCSPACPSASACATWNAMIPPAPSAARCLARCDILHPCTDPLLDCQAGGGLGTLGFQLPGEPAGTQVCAPKRCAQPADCPGGVCKALGAASFCQRL